MLVCLMFLAVILLEYTILMTFLRGKPKGASAPKVFQGCRREKKKEKVLTIHDFVAVADAVLK